MDTPYYPYSTPPTIIPGFTSNNLHHDYYVDHDNYCYNYYYAQSVPQSPPSAAGGEVMFCPSSGGSSSVSDAASTAQLPPQEDQTESEIRAKISAHPLYPRLIQAYVDCQKVILVCLFALYGMRSMYSMKVPSEK